MWLYLYLKHFKIKINCEIKLYIDDQYLTVDNKNQAILMILNDTIKKKIKVFRISRIIDIKMNLEILFLKSANPIMIIVGNSSS